MKIKLLALTLLTFTTIASAEVSKGDHRFSLSGGLIIVNNPSQTAFSVGAEYEYRIEPLYGLGLQASHVFATNSFTILSAPAFFLHPLSGDWYISAAPVFYFASGTSATGARFTTRMPLNIDILTLTPTVGVDIIDGGPNWIFGLGISI